MEVIASETEVDNYMESIFSDAADAADALSSPMGKDVMARPGSPDSQPSIDFSAATPESTKGVGFGLPDVELDGLHDSFDLNESLDLFSNEGGMDDDKSISDMSSEDESKRKSQKQRKQKPMKERKAPKEKKEEPEIKKISVVETEIEVIKKLESGPTVAELRRRNLIEIDQDELEERVEKLNKVTLKVMTSSLGLNKAEQLQKIIECREFLKKYWDDGELGDFIEDTIDKTNNRLYGNNATPIADAMDYLDRATYSDDESEAEEEAVAAPTATAVKVEPAPLPVQTIVQGAVPSKDGLIELSDSDDSDEDEEEAGGNQSAMSPAIAAPANTSTGATAPMAPTAAVTAAVVTPPLDPAARAKQAQGERQRAADAERERLELQRRKDRFLAASKAPKSSRAALLTALRQKVHQTAKENYCNQAKIQSEQLAVRLQIAEKCRLLVELLKDRQENRILHKREARKAKYQKLADADEEEFDGDNEDELAEGQYLTAEEKAAILRGFDASDSESESDEDAGSDVGSDAGEDMDVDASSEQGQKVRPVDEERMGVQGLENAASDAESDASSEADDADDDDEDGQGQETEPQITARLLRGDNSDPEADAERPAGSDAEEEVMKISRPTRARDSATDVSIPAGRKFGTSRVNPRMTTGESEEPTQEDLMDLENDTGDAGSILAKTAETQHAAPMEGGDLDNDSVANLTTLTSRTAKSRREKKSKSTGNALYRLALEEEERRSRRHKSNALLEDEAAEEEEEGAQAGLGDFGFGVTSNIREHDEEQNALKFRKGDFDHIVDDVSDGEGDEVAGAAARAEMELREDRERDRAIITAVTEGHDAMRKMQKKGKYTFDKLVGEGSRSRRGEGDGTAEEVAEEELDEEEMLQRGMKDRFDREYQSRARRGRNADSDSDSAEGSDTEENLLELDTTDMTEEEKVLEMERLQRLREKNRMDALMAKQRIQSYKMARERVRQEKIQRQMSQAATGSGLSGSGSGSIGAGLNTFGGITLMRQDSHGSRPAFSKTMSLEPLHDQYSRLIMQSLGENSAAGFAAGPTITTSSSSSNLMLSSGPSTVSPRSNSNTAAQGVVAGFDGTLADITNVPQQQVKRRTMQAPKHGTAASVLGDKRAMRRGQSVGGQSSTSAGPAGAGVEGGLYRGELNKHEVESGYGMGMALPSSTRNSAQNGKVDMSGGLFSAVTGIRRFGDIGKSSTIGGPGASNTLKKRTFSEVGKLSSTVAAQQFVFTGADESSQFSRHGDSSTGFGGRSASVSTAAGSARPRVLGGMSGHSNSASQAHAQAPVVGSLFAQLGAKRGASSLGKAASK